ncbi:MAG: hypothetical protein Q7U71_07720 [bacterium]|nr:hypothetical protein [bacterium]
MMKKLPRYIGVFEQHGPVGLVLAIWYAIFCVISYNVPNAREPFWKILIVAVSGTLPFTIVFFFSLGLSYRFGYVCKDSELPLELRKIKSFLLRNNNRMLIKAAAANFCIPLLASFPFILFHIRGEQRPDISDIYTILSLSSFGNMSMMGIMGFVQYKSIAKNWNEIQNDYKPWPDNLPSDQKQKALADEKTRNRPLTEYENRLAKICYGSEQRTKHKKKNE